LESIVKVLLLLLIELLLSYKLVDLLFWVDVNVIFIERSLKSTSSFLFLKSYAVLKPVKVFGCTVKLKG